MTHKTTKNNPPDQLSYRAAMVAGKDAASGPLTLDRTTRSFDFAIATETPIPMWDWDSDSVMPEVLLARGALFPAQVPLLDTHSRWSTAAVYGSVRDMRVEGDRVIGRAVFSTVAAAEDTFTKYEEGHLTDFSAGYKVNAVTRVGKGEKAVIGGRTWTGPVNVVTSWTLREASCCPIGADENAKARAANNHETTTTREDKPMTEEEKERMARIESTLVALSDGIKKQNEENNRQLSADDEIEKMRTAALRNDALHVQKERERITSIRTLFAKASENFGIDFLDLETKAIGTGLSMEQAQQMVIDRMATAPPRAGEADGVRVAITADERDKFRAAAVEGLQIRAGVALEKVKDHGNELAGYTMAELARRCLMMAGERNIGPDRMEMFKRAMSTSDFSNILADVANKSMLEGFEKAEETYPKWCDTSGRVSDFKPHVFARAGEAPTLVEINPDGGEYKYGKRDDTKETVTVVDFGIIVPFTRKAMVNDDLGALADTREKLGEAANRKYGDLAYAVLTGNPAMGDGTALFHANHGNLVASGTAPAVAGLNLMAAAMATQKDLSGLQNLNIIPVFLLHPWALKGTVDNLLTNTSPIAPGTAAAPVINPWSYLKPVPEARLDAASATAWYLAARAGKTVRLFFLNGQQAPVLETRVNWFTDSVEFKVRVTAAAKAVDYRGLAKNPGA